MKDHESFEFKSLLRNLREQKGWSRKELAAKAGISSKSIEKYEQGVREPNADTVTKLAQALEVSLFELTGSVGEFAAFNKLARIEALNSLCPSLAPAVRDSLLALIDNLEYGKIKSEHFPTSDITSDFGDLFTSFNELFRPEPPVAEFVSSENSKFDLKKESQWEQSARDQASKKAREALESIINLLNPKHE